VSHFSEEYQVIAVDLPGFGKSGNNRSEWTMTTYGKDISALIQQLDLKKVVLVGFSLGGPVVIEAAAEVKERIIGVVLVDALQDVDQKIPPHMVPHIDSMMMDLINNPTKKKLVENGFIKKDLDSAFHRLSSLLEGASHIGWRESLASSIKWRNEYCVNAIKDIKAPTIAINSDLQPTNVEAFKRYVPSFQAKIINDVGHLLMWDDSEGFNRVLEESIQEFIMK
jgi:pimeloyl-ACP methyl ester carboxylesterase